MYNVEMSDWAVGRCGEGGRGEEGLRRMDNVWNAVLVDVEPSSNTAPSSDIAATAVWRQCTIT
jgi:hypothetical protein